MEEITTTTESSMYDGASAAESSNEEVPGLNEQFELSPSFPPAISDKVANGCTTDKITGVNLTGADFENFSSLGEDSSRKLTKKSLLRACEVILVAFALLVIIGLFSIPTIFYALPPIDSTEVSSPGNKSNDCEDVTPYSGSICSDYLTSLQVCYSDTSSSPPPPPLNLPSAVDQQQGESNAVFLLNGLSLVAPSAECLEGIRPFVCLHLFGLCDTKGSFHTVTREGCVRLRDSVCASEWARAESFLPGILPVCEDLADNSEKCTALESSTISSDRQPLNCSEGFYFDENGTGLCRPECGQFEPISYGLVILERFFVCLGPVVSIIMFILAFTLQRSTLLVFPSILLVYFCGSIFVLGAVTFVGFFDNTKLFCGSQDQIYSTEQGNETAYCTISGIIFYYSVEQMCIWAVLHAGFLFWATHFPFSYRKLQTSGKMRHCHIGSVLVAFTLPLLGALIPLGEGHVNGHNPAYTCVGRNGDYTYYTFILPVSIALAATSCLLMLAFWMIFKAFVIKELMAGKKVSRVGKAEVKIMIVFIYYVLVGVSGLISSTYAGYSNVSSQIQEVFICESTGDLDCSHINLDTFHRLGTLSVVNIVILYFSPVIAVLISINPNSKKSKR